jgi:uncharacterized protein YjbI with pentapeptide repeats
LRAVLLAERILEPTAPLNGASVELNAALDAHEAFIGGRGPAPQVSPTYVVARGCNVERRKLMDIDFTGADLSQSSFRHADLTRAVFDEALLQGCHFEKANLRKASLRRATLSGALMAGANLEDADLRGATLTLVEQGRGKSSASLAGARLDKALLDEMFGEGVDFAGASLRGVKFGRSVVRGANFDGADLDGADLSDAVLTGATFHGAVLTGVDIEALGLPAAAVAGCLRDPTPAALARANEIRTALDRAERWIETGGAEGEPANLKAADLRVVHQAFSRRSLGPLAAPGAIGVGVDFSGSQLQGANLEGADLRNADFRGADLRGASFLGANLAHANLAGANTGELALPNGRKLPTRFDAAKTSA